MGEAEKIWATATECVGWLNLQSGDSKYERFKAKTEESTHIFICDFSPKISELSGYDVRAIIKDAVYDVLLVDDPMELGEHLEIYLRRVGAWNG